MLTLITKAKLIGVIKDMTARYGTEIVSKSWNMTQEELGEVLLGKRDIPSRVLISLNANKVEAYEIRVPDK